jgi:nucleotide-binding universal stress UspA family protein
LISGLEWSKLEFKNNTMSSNHYLVPHDFTPAGDAALKYAIHLSKHLNVEIKLLHVVQSKSDIIKAQSKLEEIISNTEKHSDVEYSALVQVGSIFDEIGKAAKNESVQLIVMGTHGSKGLQKIMGSYAMKLITCTNTPFVVVQKDTPVKEIKHIVVPIDLSKESLQIINNAGDMATMFGATVHLLGEKQNDESLSIKMKNRIHIVKNQLTDRNISCVVELIPQGGSYYKKIMNYARTHEIDMLAVAYYTESLFPQFDTFAQSLITNEDKLPCLIINSKPADNLYF